MAGDETAESGEAIADAEAIDEALAAFEDACAQLTQVADKAADHPHGRRHLAAVRERLDAVSVPVTAATADALLSAAADARTALQRVLNPDQDGHDSQALTPQVDAAARPGPVEDRAHVTGRDRAADDDPDGEADDDPADEADGEVEEFAESDPVLDLAPESDLYLESDPALDPGDEQVEPPPAPTGYQASTSLPTRNLPHVLVFEDGRWQRGSIVFAPDDTLIVRLATARRGPGRRLEEYTPAQIARPQARG